METGELETGGSETGQTRGCSRRLEWGPGIGCLRIGAQLKARSLSPVKPALVKHEPLALVKRKPRKSKTALVWWRLASGHWETSTQRRKRPDRWRMDFQQISSWLRCALEHPQAHWRHRNWQEGRRGP